jgi:hypothetical protein
VSQGGVTMNDHGYRKSRNATSRSKGRQGERCLPGQGAPDRGGDGHAADCFGRGPVDVSGFAGELLGKGTEPPFDSDRRRGACTATRLRHDAPRAWRRP